jgi:hypothetical protein
MEWTLPKDQHAGPLMVNALSEEFFQTGMTERAQRDEIGKVVIRRWAFRPVAVNVMNSQSLNVAAQPASVSIARQHRIFGSVPVERVRRIGGTQFQVVRAGGFAGKGGFLAVHAQSGIALPLPHAAASLAANLRLSLTRQVIPVALASLLARCAHQATGPVPLSPTADARPFLCASIARSVSAYLRFLKAQRAVDTPLREGHFSAPLTQSFGEAFRLRLFDRLRVLGHVPSNGVLLSNAIGVTVVP